MLRRTAALATAGALALGGVALLIPTAAGAVGAATPAPTPAAAGPAQHKRLLTPAERRELRSTGHITLTRATKRFGTVTVAVQRGSVTAVSPTSISLRSKDGYTHTYTVTAATKVRSHKQVVPLSELKVGAKAQVIALGDTARRIRFR